MLDTLQIIFWSIAYILIIVAGFESTDTKKVSMPYVASVLIFSWEIVALVNYRHWGHFVWISLDLLIVAFGFYFLKSNWQRLNYALGICITVIALFFLFDVSGGMLISSFVIDLIMSVDFLIKRKQLSGKMKTLIAITKLIGDAFAGLYYSSQSVLITAIAFAVLICNSVYLYLCWCENDVSSQ